MVMIRGKRGNRNHKTANNGNYTSKIGYLLPVCLRKKTADHIFEPPTYFMKPINIETKIYTF